MKYDLKAPVKDEEAYEVFNLSWFELSKELESLRKHCSDNKNPEYNIDEVIITIVENRDKIKVELTEDQVRQLHALVSIKEITMGRKSKQFTGSIKKSYEDESAFWRRILTKLAKAKS